MSNTAKSPKPPAKTEKSIKVQTRQGESDEAAVARLFTDPCTLAGLLLHEETTAIGGVPALDVRAFIDEVAKQAAAIAGGDLSRVETMLAAQLHVLDAMFLNLVSRSHRNSGAGYLPAAEIYMKLGLRAQSQCRATAEALGELKNPKSVAFVRQANIANGPQQVNNGAAPRAKEIANAQSKLLEAESGQRLDTRAPGTTGAADQELETVGAIDRTNDGEG